MWLAWLAYHANRVESAKQDRRNRSQEVKLSCSATKASYFNIDFWHATTLAVMTSKPKLLLKLIKPPKSRILGPRGLHSRLPSSLACRHFSARAPAPPLRPYNALIRSTSRSISASFSTSRIARVPEEASRYIPPDTTSDNSTSSESTANRSTPSYELTFTCRPCLARSTHTVSKQGYHKGTVLITCPSCKNRHVISDHLKVRCTPASCDS